MKINSIKTKREYNIGELAELVVTIDFDTSNTSDKPDGDALYYLICALDKCNGKYHKDLNLMDKMQVLNRLDATMAKLDQIRKDLEWLKEKK
jgi:hypothetical protein